MRVLIVDDSPVVRMLLREILEADGMQVAGEAADGLEALDWLARERADVVTMDIHMPNLDGYQTTRRLMEEFPIPVVVVTGSYDVQEASIAMKALEAGAMAVVQKPNGPSHPDFERDAAELVKTVRCMAEVKVVRRLTHKAPKKPPRVPGKLHPRVIAIGASTGGPVALRELLAALDRNLPWPILVVQHISIGFLPSFRDWLADVTALPIVIPRHGESVMPGKVYLAPDDRHMGVFGDGRIMLADLEPVKGLRPAVAYLFESVAQSFGSQAIAILLSGMGKDGAREMGLLKEKGALTLVQDSATAVINGMPGEAVLQGAACRALSPMEMAELLNRLASRQRAEGPQEIVTGES